MLCFVRALLAMPLLCLSITEVGRSDSPQSNAQACCADSPAGDHGELRGKEILGPRLGEFIFIPAGEFTMGRNNGESTDERPEHVVELSSFYVERTPVTNSQFVQFLNEARIPSNEYLFSQVQFLKPSIALADGKWACKKDSENDAACCGSWVLAEKYCNWLSAKAGQKCRLPTETEWEYVCRGKEGRKFPWGNNDAALERKIWGWRTWKPDKPNSVPVGSFSEGATPEGVCDLVGYMDEVCSDWYDPEHYAKSPRKNPQGPNKPLELEQYRNAKVTRGGLERSYKSETAVGRLFRDSQFFGVLPSTYLPRGWSRGKTVPPKEPRFVYGLLGFRVVVEASKTGQDKTSRSNITSHETKEASEHCEPQ